LDEAFEHRYFNLEFRKVSDLLEEWHIIGKCTFVGVTRLEKHLPTTLIGTFLLHNDQPKDIQKANQTFFRRLEHLSEVE